MANQEAGLFQRLVAQTTERCDLQQAAQLALQVEFTTIPAYLTSLYSLVDPSTRVFATLRSVVMEEMFHLNQAANLVSALGAAPKFTGDAVPLYPAHLPKANPRTTPLVGVYRASPEVFADVFAAIERPAPYGAPPEGDQYDSIAQLYEALKLGILRYPGNPFEETGPGRQRTDIYLGKFGGTPVDVRCKKSALRAIDEIVGQGEGAVPLEAPLVPFEPYGSYNHYGDRTDGTYGPITGTPYELSHFIKFSRVAQSSEPFPATWPILSNPRGEDIDNPDAIEMMRVFNNAYSVMLKALERAFLRNEVHEQDPYFAVVFGCMRQVLPNLARVLMQLPARRGGDHRVGPNAAPVWRFQSGATSAALVESIGKVIHQLGSNAPGASGGHDAQPPLGVALDAAESLLSTASAHGI